jgi:hypothetical protein
LGAALDTLCSDERYTAIENRDEAEVANRLIRKKIGKRGAQILDAVIAHNTLEPAELAEALAMQPGAINSQFYAIRQKGKLLKL